MGHVDALRSPEGGYPTPQPIELEELEAAHSGPQSNIYELMAEQLAHSLKLVVDLIDNAKHNLSALDQQRVDEMKQKINDYLEELKKAKKASGLMKFLNIFAGLGLALAMLAAALIPSPATIAIAAVTIAIFLEPMIAQAAGGESIINKAMSSMFKFLEEKLGMGGAVAVMLGVMLAAAAGSVAVATRGMSAAAGGIKNLAAAARTAEEAGEQVTTAQALAKSLEKIAQHFEKFLSSKLTPEEMAVFSRSLDMLQAGVVVAQGGLQTKVAVVKLDIAKLRYRQSLAEADLNLIDKVIDETNRSTDRWMQLYESMLDLHPFG